MNKRLIWGLGIVALLVVTATAFWISGQYPAMIVNGKMISMKAIELEVGAENFVAENLGEIYAETFEGRDLNLQVLNAKLEDILILEELNKQIEPGILKELQDTRLEELSAYGNLDEASRELYGISFESLKETFLLPLVRRGILENQFVLMDKDFSEWLGETKKSANVRILMPGLGWNSEGAVIERK